jgi:hypothetical protein
VPGVTHLLDRFRPAGTPGAVAAVSVPADLRHDAAVELAPVFVALTATVQEAVQIRADAQMAANAARAAADRAAAETLARARDDAGRQRSRAAARQRQVTAREVALLAQNAGNEARRIRRAAERHRPTLVRAVLEEVRASVGAACGLPVDEVPPARHPR